MTATIVSQSAADSPSRERVELILSQLDRLPTLPAVVTRLLAVTTSEASSASDVVEVIESDAALTATVLRMIRRADLGIRDDAMTVSRAVTLLGFNNVRNAVLSLQLYEAFAGEDGASKDEIRPELWRHNIAVACLAEMLADRAVGGIDAGEAFVCGLLHDIGKVALDACLPKSYARAVEIARRRHVCISDTEREVFGFDHTVAGRRVVARWQLSQAIVDCVWLHHHPPDALPSTVVSPRLVGIIHLADSLVRSAGVGYSGYAYFCDIESLAAHVRLPSGAIDAALEALPDRISPFIELIGLPGTSASLRTSLLAANKHLGEVNARLSRENRGLTVHARCLQAVERLWDRLAANGDIGDVCAASAESLCSLVNADAAVSFFAPPGRQAVYAACAEMGVACGGASLFDLGDAGDWRTSLGGEAGTARPLMAAPGDIEAIWRRVAGVQAAKPLWALPVFVRGRLWGASLVAVEEEAVRPFLAAHEQCRIIGTAVALALDSACARAGAQQVNDELLDLNRRLREAQEQAVQVRSIGMIAAMAAGAAHEMNNPLAVVSGRAQMELARCEDDDLKHTLETIIEHTQRTADIVSDLMRFAKPEPPSPIAQSLRDPLESLCQHWRSRSSRPEARIRCTLSDPDATVFADPLQLREILDALMANAVEATEAGGGGIHVNSPSRASDETVRIVVEDDGVGMTRDVLAHAFDPFYSNRPAGRGRGLGLSRAYRFAEINGGRLWLDSKPGLVTTVTVELPARPPAN